MTTNAQLQKFYDGVYTKGERQHYTQFRLNKDLMTEEFAAVLDKADWKDKKVMDVGCGTGDMCAFIIERGAASVLGVDYAESAIKEAEEKYQAPNLKFLCENVDNIDQKFDVIISVGTLEHMDDPFSTLKKLKGMLNPGGFIVTSSPNWTNPRGYVLQTLLRMFNAPITLADIHYLGPIDFEEWAKKLDMNLEWSTVEQEWGNGEKMIKDFERRLPNVTRDAGWNTTKEQIDDFIKWLQTRVVPLKTDVKHSGAVGVYKLMLR